MDQQTQSKTQDLWVYLVTFTLGIGPFFSGMFYEPGRLLGILLPSLAIFIWGVGQLRNRGLLPVQRINSLDIGMGLWLGAYLLSSIGAIYPRGHLVALVGLAAMVALYTWSKRQPEAETTILYGLFGFGTLMVILTLARGLGLEALDRLFINLIIENRLSGGFQYANSFAAWLGILTLFLMSHSRREGQAWWTLALSGIFALASVMTLSRGGLVLMPIAIGAMLFFAPKADRAWHATAAVLIWAPSIALGGLAMSLLNKGSLLSLLLVALCAGVPCLTPLLSSLTGKLFTPGKGRMWLATAGIVVIIGGIVVGPRLLSLSTSVLNSRLTSGYSLNNSSTFQRVSFYQDALKLIAERPLIGSGGDSWKRLYFGVQQFRYFSTEVHNHYLQAGVEAGLPGLLAFTFVGVAAVLTAWRIRRLAPDHPQVGAMVAVVVYLWVHAFLDFDFSYMSFLLLTGFVLGRLSGILSEVNPNQGFPLRHTMMGTVILSGFAGLVALSLSTAFFVNGLATKRWSPENPETSVRLVKAAARFDPLSARFAGHLAWFAEHPNVNHDDVPTFEASIRRAYRLDPYDVSFAADVGRIALDEQDWTTARDIAWHIYRSHPLEVAIHDVATHLLWSATDRALKNGDDLIASEIASEFLPMRNDLAERIARAKAIRFNRADVAHGALSHLRLGQGLVVSGEIDLAIEHLIQAQASSTYQAEATRWLFLAYVIAGDELGAAELRNADSSVAQFESDPLFAKVMKLNGK